LRTLIVTALAASAAIGASMSAATAAPLIVGTLYQETSKLTCSGPQCSVPFTQIPVGKNLLVTDVNCTVTVPKGYLVFKWELLGKRPVESGVRKLVLTAAETLTYANYTSYVLKADGRHIIVGGDRPDLGGSVLATAGLPLSPGDYIPVCTLSGVIQ